MSRDLLRASRTRCLAVWLLATTAAVGVAGALVPHLLAEAPRRGDAVVVAICEAALVACAGWAWLVTSVVVADAWRGRVARRRGIPAAWRQVVLTACAAAPGRSPDQVGPASSARTAPLPDRTTAAGLVGGVFARRARAERPARASTVAQLVTVRAGDTLWGLVSARLPHHADDAVVARACARVHALNRAVIGPDPDLIHPGQRLALPDLTEEPR